MITQEQRLARKNFMGSSDVSSIFNYNPHKTDYGVFVSKVYDTADGKLSPSAEMGNKLEDTIVKWTAKKAGLGEIITDPDELYFICKDYPLFASNLDGIPVDGGDNCAIEAKYTTMVWEWGEPCSKDFPRRLWMQTQQQMLCSGRDTVVVGVFLDKERILPRIAANFGFTNKALRAMSNMADKRYYVIERNDPIISLIVDTCTKWWQKYVIPARESDTPEKFAPKITEPPRIETFKTILPEEGKAIKISEDEYFRYLMAQQKIADAKKEKDEAWAGILREKGNAEYAIFPDGSTFKFRKELGGVKLNHKRMKLESPKRYERLMKSGYLREVTKNVGRTTKPSEEQKEAMASRLPF